MESQEKESTRMLQNSVSAFTVQVALLVHFITGKPQLATGEEFSDDTLILRYIRSTHLLLDSIPYIPNISKADKTQNGRTAFVVILV